MAKVLIVDGDAAGAHILKDALAARGVVSVITPDGTEGLALARSDLPNAIVLCVELSRVSGYSICNKLKKDRTLAEIPLILTSSQATEETFEQHKKLRTRADAYLKKPYELDSLVDLIMSYLPSSSASRAATTRPSVVMEDDSTSGGFMDDLESLSAAPVPARRTPPPSDEDNFGFDADPPQRPVSRAPQGGGFDVDELLAEPARPARATAHVAREVGAVSSASVRIQNEGTDAARSEVRALRLRVQALEQTLQEKELEFNDRLLQESTRGREAVELKKRLAQYERDAGKLEQAAERARSEAAATQQRAAQLQSELEAADLERQSLSDKLGQLVEKAKALASERDALREQLEELKQARDEVGEAQERQGAARAKARKAIDIALQLINETGLVR